MKYKSQKVAYWFFALCMLLFSLQIVYGFIMGFARIGMDGLHDFIPFNTARAVHTNLLVVWLLTGFMGAAYYIIPEESQRELVNVKLAYVQLISLAVVGVVAIVGYHFNYWEGRKFSSRARFSRCYQRFIILRFNISYLIYRKTQNNDSLSFINGFIVCRAIISSWNDMV